MIIVVDWLESRNLGDGSPSNNTKSLDYHLELRSNSEAFFRRVIPVQLPYRWNMRRLTHGRTLEVGCGLGRNLAALSPDSVGLDHNSHSVEYCRSLGLDARLLSDSDSAEQTLSSSERFDTLLLAHVLEHVEREKQLPLVRRFLPFLKPGGNLLLITPQEKGYASTSSHITWTDVARLEELVGQLGRPATLVRSSSFPLHRSFGRFFTHNEFVVLASLE